MSMFAPLLPEAALATALSALLGLGIGVAADLPLAAAGIAAVVGSGTVGLAFHKRANTPFGIANTVTTIRLVLALLLLALLLTADPAGAHAWMAVGLAAAAALLDGVDGWIARRLGQQSTFGARLDMETDTVLMLVLALALVASGRAGFWLVLAGLWRPLFVMAGRLLPWLTRPLPPSRRRKVCCALPIALMIAALLPPVPALSAMLLGAVALAAVSLSFALDGWWLWQRRGLAS